MIHNEFHIQTLDDEMEAKNKGNGNGRNLIFLFSEVEKSKRAAATNEQEAWLDSTFMERQKRLKTRFNQ